MAASAPPASDVFTAAYDLFGRYFLGGPVAVAPNRLPALEALLAAFANVDTSWPERLSAVIERDSAGQDATERAFLARTAIPVTGHYVPPYASVYLDGGTLWGRSTFEVLAWYQMEGLDWDQTRTGAGGSRIAAPDHVGVEMAFLSVLSRRSVPGPVGSIHTDRLQAALDHLGRWLPRFGAALEDRDRAFPPPSTLADWTALAHEVVKADPRGRSAETAQSTAVRSVCVAVTPEGLVDPRWGRAERVAIAITGRHAIEAWVEYDVGWGQLHDSGGEGAHHARIARFLKEHEVQAVVATHVGAGMEHMLEKMGIELRLSAGGRAKEAVLAVNR